MTRLFQILVNFIVPGCLLILAFIALRIRILFHRALRLRHPDLWANLSGRGLVGPVKLRYANWFWSRGYDQINDREIEVLGSRLTGASILALGLFIVWIVFA